jgi:hypothetical protein
MTKGSPLPIKQRHAAILLGAAGLAMSCARPGNDAQPADESGDAAVARPAELAVATYAARQPNPVGPQPAFHTASASGTVTASQGCLALRTGSGTYLLVLPEAAVGRSGGTVLVDGQALAQGRRISVTGSATGGPAVGAVDIPPGCSGLERFVVSPGGVAPE